MRRYVLSLAVLALLFTVVGQAHASLVGDEILIQYLLPTLFGAGTPTVAEGPNPAEFEFSIMLGDTTVFADVDASTISITFGGISGSTFFSPADFNGLEFSGLEWVGMPDGKITGFLLDTNISGLTGSRVFPDASLPLSGSGTAGPHSIAVNFSDLMGITNVSFVNIALLTEGHNAPIPEPGTLLLIGSGLVGIGVGARRRNRRK